jgi:hypothetical protein
LGESFLHLPDHKILLDFHAFFKVYNELMHHCGIPLSLISFGQAKPGSLIIPGKPGLAFRPGKNIHYSGGRETIKLSSLKSII